MQILKKVINFCFRYCNHFLKDCICTNVTFAVPKIFLARTTAILKLAFLTSGPSSN